MSIAEAVMVHLVVMRWSVTAPRVLTGLSIYGTVWLIALSRSFRLLADAIEVHQVFAYNWARELGSRRLS